ncbi:flagellar biosynthesis regulator FlhF [Betaproteobacteria bacterium]|nr:flagellar biosynthesis regulator FlhF [Betaproteobacteria bacterium]GHU01384.1 flagellar biosynthesis regulator FlhF [Betaproteobacteria bacterium]
MDVKRYFAPTTREALRALKEELGADAIVLSNRAVDGGVEIVALPANAVGALQNSVRQATREPVASAPQPAPRRAAYREEPVSAMDELDDDDFHVTLSSLAADAIPRDLAASAPRRPLQRQTPPPAPAARQSSARPVVRPFTPPRIETADYVPRAGAYRDAFRAAADADVAQSGQAQSQVPERMVEKVAERVAAKMVARGGEAERVKALQESNVRLMDEITDIRVIIERQLAGFAWNETRRQAPVRAEVLGHLLETGFSGVTARWLAELIGEDAEPAEAMETVRSALDQRLRVRDSDTEIIDRGGVYALVGPTGVGKTTTTAKLAARCVMRHGANRMALITTDGYRIGAQEQLRIYGRILGVPVFTVKDAADLRQTLAELSTKHMVLIDTMGMSQRDRMVAAQAAMLAGAGRVKRLLLLNATCRGDTLDDVIRAYAGPDLAGCMFTKVDEAATLAPVIDVAVRHELEVFYVTNGQRVPEDFHLPNRAYLLHRALRGTGAESPWRLDGDEAGMLLAAQGA